jgi:hypothetical protein
MLDDLSDAKEDLISGRETLVTEGFFKKNGTKIKITQNLIDDFLNQDRMLRIYKTSRLLLEDANKIFEDHNDEIFLLFTEFFTLNFHKQFDIAR